VTPAIADVFASRGIKGLQVLLAPSLAGRIASQKHER